MSSKRRDNVNPKGGKGSNQYTVRGRSITDTEAAESRAAYIASMKGVDPVSADTSGDSRAHELVSRLDEALSHSQSDDLPDNQTDNARSEVRMAENDIYNAYPYSYASAMVNSTYSEHPSLISEESKNADFEVAEELRDSYDKVRLDATGSKKLTEDQLTESLNHISELESKVRNEEYDKEEVAVANAISAKIVGALRSGLNSDKLSDIGSKVNDFQERRLSHTGF